MCLLVGVLVGVQALRWVVHPNGLFLPHHGNRPHFIVHCDGYSHGWWQMMARLKAHDSLGRFEWSAASCNQAASNVVKRAALFGTIKSASRFDDADES